MWKEHITFDKKVLLGKPIIKGTRLSVDFILELLIENWTYESIIENYPKLKRKDITACIEYALEKVKEEEVFLINESN
jgi:uncharacterized protein (DUF433 family)